MNSTECIDSATAATIRIVKSCPQNIKKWNEAAVRKGCEKIKHTCSSFEYHCVINAWGNETIEICAPSLMIIGKNASIYLKLDAYRFIHLNIQNFEPVLSSFLLNRYFTH